jgi:hypothetical protein
MTAKTIAQLIISTALAASAVAALELSPSLASTPVLSALPAKSEVAPSDGALFVHLHRVANRFTADCAGLKLAPPPIVCLTP